MRNYETPVILCTFFAEDVLMASDENSLQLDSFADLLKLV